MFNNEDKKEIEKLIYILRDCILDGAMHTYGKNRKRIKMKTIMWNGFDSWFELKEILDKYK